MRAIPTLRGVSLSSLHICILPHPSIGLLSTFVFPLHTCCHTDHLVFLSSCILFSPAVLIFLLKGYEPGLCALRIRKRISSNIHTHTLPSSFFFTFTSRYSPPTSSSPNLIVLTHLHHYIFNLTSLTPHRRYYLFINISPSDIQNINIPPFDIQLIDILDLAYNRQLLPCSPS